MRSGQSNQRHMFSQVPKAEIQRSKFDRSSNFKTTMNSGFLNPIFVDEVLPGDTFNMNVRTFARLSTPLHPVMDNMYADVFFFFVPNRLIWTHFVNFFGEQANPTDSTSFLVPTATSPAGGYANGSLQDLMGIPPGIVGITHNQLHMRAYNLIWNQWFRDQNMQNSVVVDMGDGPDTVSNYVLLRRGKRHDYFTAAFPFPQKGPAVSIPLGQTAVVKTSATEGFTGVQTPMEWRTGGAGALPTANNVPAFGAGGLPTNQGTLFNSGTSGTGAGTGLYPSNLIADLSTATSATINQLRQAFQIQKIYEKDARGGTRYTESIQAHFGVVSPDARLQRAEYLGGGSTPVNVNPIAQTSGTGATGTSTPQGSLAAMGVFSHTGGVGFTKSFTEHGVIVGLLEVRADLNYQQGLNKMWSRQTRFDYYWPSLAQIGEQSVLNQEIFCQGTAGGAADAATFGYQERYAEYRYMPSRIAGQFRSSFATPLDSWHLAQNFSSLPALNATFIQDTPPISRIVAVPSQPEFLLDVHFNLMCARPMPVYGVPGNMDRF